MLSPADMLIIGAAALIFFGPDQLPKVAKRAGQVVREVQNTSQSFIREMERAADDTERREREAAMTSPAAAPAASSAPAEERTDAAGAGHHAEAKAAFVPGQINSAATEAPGAEAKTAAPQPGSYDL